MNKKEIFSQVIHMEERIGALHDELGELKEQLVMLIEENQALMLENKHLRKRLDNKEEEAEKKETEKPTPHLKANPGEGYDNLARLYHEGSISATSITEACG